NVAPSSISSWRICWLSGGWLMCRRRAARPKCSSSATTANARRALEISGIRSPDEIVDSNIVLDDLIEPSYTPRFPQTSTARPPLGGNRTRLEEESCHLPHLIERAAA